MVKALAWFDAWVATSPVSSLDLARFRIILSVGALLTMFDFSWFSPFPASMYIPPPGPFKLLPGFPPEPIAIALEIGIALAFASLAVGYRTTVASWSASILMLLGFGFSYSLGKIDHPILFIIAPAVLSFTGWGDRLSVDARRGRTHGHRAWPLRLLAVLIGLAFFTAGVAKLRAGWLSPETQAARREFLTAYVDGNRGGILPSLVEFDAVWFWELFDWATVIIETGMLVTVLSWTAFRIAIAAATIFHFGVFVLLAISFGFNVLVYGAFVRWSAVPVQVPRWAGQITLRWYALLIPVTAVSLWGITQFIPQTSDQSGYLVVAGGGIASGYLFVMAYRGLRSLGRERRSVVTGRAR